MNNTVVLIVDDDPRGRKLLGSFLKPKGYSILMASSGEEALEVARESQPDVMLMDVMMPGMTGLEVCRRIKGNPETRLTQIMMVTALAGQDDRVEGLDTGADDYIAKPVPKVEFLAKVRSLVRASILLNELETARRELEARNRELELKKTLSQTVVHDLKGPLTAVVGNLDLLSRKSAHHDDMALARARKGAERMSTMIMDLLDVEYLEDGAFEPMMEECYLLDLAREAIDSFQTQGDHLGIELALDLASGPCMAEVDPNLLRRVVDNLLANAINYSKNGMKIAVTVGHRPEGVMLAVTDQGPGVPAGQREQIFEKYSRADSPGVPMRENRGLGLTFCQMAVEAHGGTIWVEDGPAGGASFQFVLPELVDQSQVEFRVENDLWFGERPALARQAV
jgi:two-component system sensor histidine kinase/response regulator